MQKFAIGIIVAGVVVIGFIAVFNYNTQFEVGGSVSNIEWGNKSSFTATTTAVNVSATKILDPNGNADFRSICLRPADYASTTIYLNLASSTSIATGGGLVLSSSTQTCAFFDRGNPYIGTIYGITGSTSSVVVGEY